MKKDLALISGEFFLPNVSKEEQYLAKYFKTDLEKQFLMYLQVFGDVKYFKQHTGRAIGPEAIIESSLKYKTLTDSYKAARQSGDFELLSLLESGKFRWRKHVPQGLLS